MDEPDPRLVEQLRDLHFPAAPASWPPEPGWWLLALVVLLISTLILWRWYQRYKTHYASDKGELRAVYQSWQKHHDTAHYLQDMNKLLRRYAMQRDGRDAIARLQGESWRRWLSADSPSVTSTAPTHTLSPATLQALTLECYQPHPRTQVELVHDDINQWLQQQSGNSVHRRRHA